MTPLDLSTRPPRGPRESLDGLMFMPRTIDKIRASLPGGNLGPYVLDFGLTPRLLSIIGIDLAELTEIVRVAQNDEDVAAWLRVHADTSRYEEANATLSTSLHAKVPPDQRARFESLYPKHLIERHPVGFDLLEADDRELYSESPK